MSKRISYRRLLLQAVEAFLDGTPSSRVRAQHIVQRCYAAINSEDVQCTLDDIIWRFFVVALTDSVFYESEVSLQEMREVLRGHSPQNIAKVVFNENYSVYFTTDEEEWYTHLLSMVDFIAAVPFANIHQATFAAWQDKATWVTTRQIIPEAIQAEEIEAEYQRRKELIETIAARSPSPQNMGDETIYHLVLREATTVITGMSVGRAAVYCGYPMLDGSYSGYGVMTELAAGFSVSTLDMTESVKWAKRTLEALVGQGGLFISWRLSKAPTFDADVLLVSLHA